MTTTEFGALEAHVPVVRSAIRIPGIEWVKTLAFVAMIVDHVGGLVLRVPKFSWMYQVGRLAFPMFAVVLACKLAVRTAEGHDTLSRQGRKLLLWALIAQLPYALAAGRWMPLNIFFTLWLGCLGCRLAVERWSPANLAGWLFVVAASALADYGLSGVLLIVAIFCAVIVPTTRMQGPRLDAASLVAAALAMCMLAVGNESWWTLAAVPAVLLTGRIEGGLPVPRWFWYVIYPAHLALIGLLRIASDRMDWAHWIRPPSCLVKAAEGTVAWAQCWL